MSELREQDSEMDVSARNINEFQGANIDNIRTNRSYLRNTQEESLPQDNMEQSAAELAGDATCSIIEDNINIHHQDTNEDDDYSGVNLFGSPKLPA